MLQTNECVAQSTACAIPKTLAHAAMRVATLLQEDTVQAHENCMLVTKLAAYMCDAHLQNNTCANAGCEACASTKAYSGFFNAVCDEDSIMFCADVVNSITIRISVAQYAQMFCTAINEEDGFVLC